MQARSTAGPGLSRGQAVTGKGRRDSGVSSSYSMRMSVGYGGPAAVTSPWLCAPRKL